MEDPRERKVQAQVPGNGLAGPPGFHTEIAARGLTGEPRARLAKIEEWLLGYVLRVIDLARLYQLEQCLWSELDRAKIHDEGDIADALLAAVFVRVASGPHRHANSIPHGITGDEVMAAEYDDECLMCRHETSDLEYRLSGRKCQDLQRDAVDTEMRRFMDQAAKRWREEHATALRRFGLA